MNALPVITMPLASLKPHPENYQTHEEDELEHLRESIKANNLYRNIVISKDDFILCGHGVAKACEQLGIDNVPCVRMPWNHDDMRAIKLLASDNEISHLAHRDDRKLTELLKTLAQSDVGLLGTGMDEQMVAALAMVTRPESEIADFDAAAEWLGMPSMGEEQRETRVRLIVWCDTEEERNDALQVLGVEIVARNRDTVSIQWPEKEREVREDSSKMWEAE